MGETGVSRRKTHKDVRRTQKGAGPGFEASLSSSKASTQPRSPLVNSDGAWIGPAVLPAGLHRRSRPR